jgi:hypothetical protein
MPRLCLNLAAVLLLMLSGASGTVITWISTKDHYWSNKTNWSPEIVPGAHDDVVMSSGTWAIVETPATVKSLQLGGLNSSSYLQVWEELKVIGTLSVESGATLDLSGPGWVRLILGQGNIAGTFCTFADRIRLSGSFLVSSTTPAQLMSDTIVFSDARFNSTSPVQFSSGSVVILNQSTVIGITSTIQAAAPFTIVAQDDTDVVFDNRGGSFNMGGDGSFSVHAPVLLGTFETISSQLNITQGSLVLTNTTTMWVSGVEIDVGESGRLTVGLTATLLLNGPSILKGHARSAQVVNHGVINVTGGWWEHAAIQNISLLGNGSVSASEELSLTGCTFSQSFVTLSGNGVFQGEDTDISLGAVIGAPVVEATIGGNSFSCPEQCDNIRTKSNFRFSIGQA